MPDPAERSDNSAASSDDSVLPWPSVGKQSRHYSTPPIGIAYVRPSTVLSSNAASPQSGRLQLDVSIKSILGANSTGSISITGELLVILITKLSDSVGIVSVTVVADSTATESIVLEPIGNSLVARLPWAKSSLPTELLLRVLKQ